MTTTKVFSIYDAKVGGFAKPFFFRTNGEALRAWMDVVNDPQSDFFRHPEDYTLFLVAEFDESKGQFINETSPLSIASAMEMRKVAHNNLQKPTEYKSNVTSIDDKEKK